MHARKGQNTLSLAVTCGSRGYLRTLNRIVHHMHPKVRHRLVKRRTASVLTILTSAAATGTRRVLNELLDALKDQLHPLPATMLVQQHKGNAQMCVVVPVIECVIGKFCKERIVRFIHSGQPFFKLDLQSNAQIKNDIICYFKYRADNAQIMLR